MSGTTVQAKPGCGPEVKLTFSPLQDVETFLHDEAHGGKRGVYMWGFCFPNPATGKRDPFIPYYVGKGDIQTRIRVHLDGIRINTHRVLKRGILLGPDCRRYFHEEDPESEYCHYAYLRKRDGQRKDLPEPQKTALQSDIAAYTENMFVTYLATNGLALRDDEGGFINSLEPYVQDKFGGLNGTEWLISQRGRDGDPADVNPTIKPGPGTEHLFPLK